MKKVLIKLIDASSFTQILFMVILLAIIAFVWRYAPGIISAAKEKFKKKASGGNSTTTVIVNPDKKGKSLLNSGDTSDFLLTIGRLSVEVKSLSENVDSLVLKMDKNSAEHKKIVDMVKKVGQATKTLYDRLNEINDLLSHKSVNVVNKLFSSFEEEE